MTNDNTPRPRDGTGGGDKQPYAPPAIIYESELTTRAGSRIEGVDYEVAPSKLFGGVD